MKKITFLFSTIFIFSLLSCELEKIEDTNLESTTARGKADQIQKNSFNFDLSEDCQKSESVLLAGQNTEVGKVTITEENGEYVIKFEMTNPEWCMTETHLSVQNSPEEFPMTQSGNPKIGNFELGNDNLDCSKEETYRVSTAEGPYIAAHAVVVCSSNSPESITNGFPLVANFCTSDEFRPDNGERYFDINIDSGVLSGEYSAWCVDLDKALGNPECIENVSVYSSLGILPIGAFEQMDNFGAVNWLLNQNLIGTPSSSGELFTGDDFQMAIWLLVDDLFDINELAEVGNVENWDEERIKELVDSALENNDFSPGCGDFIGVILDPENRQKVIIAYLMECSPCEETAWADGCDFPGGSWATYFQYN